MFSTAAAAHESRTDPVAAGRIGWACLFLLFTYVFLANHWLGDDAYITFRVAWNFVHGYGPNFNPDERVQAFTHPLWFLVISAAHFVTREFFFTTTVLLWVFGIGTLAVLASWARTLPRALVITTWLLSSKAFVDYSASGLEYPLSFLLLALFYTRLFERPHGTPPSVRELRWFLLIASLAFLNRPDAVLLYVVPVAALTFGALRAQGARALAPAMVGLIPAVVWVGFAVFYYGFPFPNTYYAKVATGIPRLIMIRQGLAYVLNSISHDPITLGTIGLALAYGWRARGQARLAAASAAVYAIYTVTVGGDFMSGRFFAMPFLVALMAVAPAIGAAAVTPALGSLLVYTLLVPLVPIKTTDRYDGAWAWRTQNGIKDERGHYHRATNILFFSPFRELPDLIFAREGLSFGASPETVAVHGSIGMFGLYAGPRKFVVDRNALSEPFLARLPVSPRLYFEFYASHYFRDIPEGYLESVATNENRISDPVLHSYYDRLRNVTRGALFDASRVRDIWWLNLGEGRKIHERYEARRPIDLSIPAGNERFLTDVGERDAGGATLRAGGRAGYLQYGPGMPLKAGAYRVRWVGVLESTPSPEIGFVEVWSGSTRLVRRRATRDLIDPDRRRLAEVDFQIADAASAIDYRLFVNADVRVTLERVELASVPAAP